ncbi:Isoflavone reductase protein [Rutstroemia sp. NJR-2017a BBW]|nr:Isoflavone reductase protein [Rutstroemia sp. NJR-2017a BBW]
MKTEIENIALVGATGNLGKYVLKHLLSSANQLNITVLTRSVSSAQTDSSVVIKEVDYDLPESLKSALTGSDALIIVLNIRSIPDTEYKLVEAAAATGVKWILPTEFGGDNGNEEIRALPISAVKTGSLKAGAFQIDVPNRKVMFINGGTPKFNTTNLETVGLAAARLILYQVVS